MLQVTSLSNFGGQAGSGLVGDEETFGSGGAVSSQVESSYIISLRDLDMKHVKDFIFLHGKNKYFHAMVIIY